MTPDQRQALRHRIKEACAADMGPCEPPKPVQYWCDACLALAALDAAEQERDTASAALDEVTAPDASTWVERLRGLAREIGTVSSVAQRVADYDRQMVTRLDEWSSTVYHVADKLAALTAPPAPYASPPEPDSAEWWRQVSQGLAAEIAKLKAERPRCEWRAYPNGPQCTRTAGHGLPHETRSDGTCGMRHETGARCTLPDGHTENHRGEFAGGVAQWPKETKSMSVTVPKDHPLMVAWTAYKDTEDYANTRRWAAHDAHVDGSLWAAFERGWLAAGGRKPFEAPPAPHAEAVRVLEELKAQFLALGSNDGRPYAQGFDNGVLWSIDRVAGVVAALRAEGEGGNRG